MSWLITIFLGKPIGSFILWLYHKEKNPEGQFEIFFFFVIKDLFFGLTLSETLLELRFENASLWKIQLFNNISAFWGQILKNNIKHMFN